MARRLNIMIMVIYFLYAIAFIVGWINLDLTKNNATNDELFFQNPFSEFLYFILWGEYDCGVTGLDYYKAGGCQAEIGYPQSIATWLALVISRWIFFGDEVDVYEDDED